jgi:uncharacterized protein (TIGR02996 family)
MQYGLSGQFADELPFIREILFDVKDEAPRWIYADWLEEQGNPRGQFLRLDLQLHQLPADDPQVAELRKQRNWLVPQIDPAWIALLAQVPIELCPQKVEFDFLCPKRWSQLKPFGDDQCVRYCDQCGKSVTYCFTIDEARLRSVRHQCVAIDPSVFRQAGDLQPTYYEELLGLLTRD